MLDNTLSITVLELAALVVLLPLFGALLGYVVAGDRLRRAAGGRDPAELREEMEDYRREVNSHFQETAALLDGMTAQYRAVYMHMAEGAQKLCDTDDAGPRLEQLRSVLLDGPGVVDVPVEDASADEASGSGVTEPDERPETDAPDADDGAPSTQDEPQRPAA